MKPAANPMSLPAALTAVLLVSLLMLGSGCTHKVEVAVTELPPIHMTLDVNIRVQRELDDLLAFQNAPAPTQPASDAATKP